ncbi:MAG: glycosyltransferase family 25 protein [Gammaproteobacteria bacterium]
MADPAHLKDVPIEHRRVNDPPPLEGQAEILNLARILIRDTSDRIVFWNAGAEKLYRWTRGEALGRVSHELLQTQFAEPLASIRAKLWRDGQWQGELLHRRRDGKQIVVASHWGLHRNDQGLPRAILEVNNDITELKHSQQTIQQLNRALANVMPGISRLDSTGRYTEVNEYYGRAARTKIIVVSMPDAQERRSRFADRARNATVAWSFFSAYSVLHPALTYAEQEAIVAKGRPLRKGELGCYSSHYGAWESLQADDADQYIVLEDDVIVDWAFIGKIVGIDFADVGIDYLRLYYKHPVEQALLRQNFVDHSRWIVELSDYAFGTQGYLITKAAAKTLLSHCRIVRRPVDDEMDRSWAHGVPNLAIVPFPIIEESVQSTISEMRFERFVIPRHLMLRRFITRVTERLRREAARVAAKCRRLRARWRDLSKSRHDPEVCDDHRLIRTDRRP